MKSGFEWDEAKREANLVKHGVDFVDALEVFAGPLRMERIDRRREYREERHQMIGRVGDQVVFVVYTLRSQVRRSRHGGRVEMSAERISKVVLGADGKPRRRLAGGRSVSLKGRTDWKRVAAMKEAEVVARARSDKDAQPVARGRLADFRRVTLTPDEVRAIRQRSGRSQMAFAAAYGLNLRTLQDWEQGRTQPDGPARAYLLVIDREPRAVARALTAAS